MFRTLTHHSVEGIVRYVRAFFSPFDCSCRVFDGEFAPHFDSKLNHGTPLKDKYFRCRNNNDVVPRMVPPPYTHVGTEIYLDRL